MTRLIIAMASFVLVVSVHVQPTEVVSGARAAYAATVSAAVAPGSIAADPCGEFRQEWEWSCEWCTQTMCGEHAQCYDTTEPCEGVPAGGLEADCSVISCDWPLYWDVCGPCGGQCGAAGACEFDFDGEICDPGQFVGFCEWRQDDAPPPA